MYKNGKLVGPVPSVIASMLANPLGQIGGFSAGLGLLLREWGLYDPLTERGTLSQDVTSDGPYLQFDTDGTLDYTAAARIYSANGAPHRIVTNPVCLVQFAVPTLTSLRLFLGFANEDYTIVDNDNPTNSCAALQFDTERAGGGDTTWKISTDDGTDQTVTDLEVAPAVDAYIAAMELSSSAFTVTLMNTSFVVLGRKTVAANLPLSSDDLWVIHGVTAKTGAVRSLQLFWGFGANRING